MQENVFVEAFRRYFQSPQSSGELISASAVSQGIEQLTALRCGILYLVYSNSTAAATLTVAITGCAKKEEGPVEKMGKGLDEATRSVEKSAEDAAESVKKAVGE